MPGKSVTCKFDKNDHYNDENNFFRFDGESFETTASSKCDHDFTYGLANYRENALTTGSRYNSDCYVRTEVYNFGNNQWNDVPYYPFSS